MKKNSNKTLKTGEKWTTVINATIFPKAIS